MKQYVVAFLKSYTQTRLEKKLVSIILNKQIRMISAKSVFKTWHKIFRKRQSLKFLETTLDFARLRIGFQSVQSHFDSSLEADEYFAERKGQHLLRQYWKAFRTHVLKKKLLSCNQLLYKEQTNPRLKTRFLRQWRSRYLAELKNVRIFKWYVCFVAREKKRLIFKALKSYSKLRHLKKLCPQMYTFLLTKRAFRVIKGQVQKRKWLQTCSNIVKRASCKKIEQCAYQVWKFRASQKSYLRESEFYWNLSRQQKVFNVLCNYSQQKQHQRFVN